MFTNLLNFQQTSSFDQVLRSKIVKFQASTDVLWFYNAQTQQKNIEKHISQKIYHTYDFLERTF